MCLPVQGGVQCVFTCHLHSTSVHIMLTHQNVQQCIKGLSMIGRTATGPHTGQV
jgi:hypothetical protein